MLELNEMLSYIICNIAKIGILQNEKAPINVF